MPSNFIIVAQTFEIVQLKYILYLKIHPAYIHS